jgi:cyclophilin family peptidyl-prolyl cis-trans isomerase
MKIKSGIFGIICFSLIFLVSGCGFGSDNSDKKDALPNPVSDPAGYVPGMLDTKKDAEKNIQNAVDQENNKINNTLNENDQSSSANTNDNQNLSKKYMYAKIITSLGEIKVKFNADNAPNAVNNFLKLANEKFYDGVKFHRVIKGFMIQSGDPLSKDESKKDFWGTGGPGYKFADELKGTEKYPQGTLAMANSGANTNGSQFFIVTASPSAPLPPNYTVFGQVVSGLDVALKIENVQTVSPGQIDRPVEDVVLKSVELLEK